MIQAISSATSFKAVYYTNNTFTEKQKKVCKDIEEKIEQSEISRGYDYLITPVGQNSVHFYNTNQKRTYPNGGVSFGIETYFGTYNEDTPFNIERLDNMHKRHFRMNLGMLGFAVVLVGLNIALWVKACQTPQKSTELVHKMDTLKNNIKKDTLDLTKRFVK